MEIGNIKLKNNVILAPMAGVTDMPYRILVKEMGAGLVYSELISAKGIFYNNSNTKGLLKIDNREKPVSIQLFGCEPKVMSEAVKLIDHLDFEILDINMGCPANKIVKNGEGSALMKDEKKVREVVSAVVKSTKKPVTVKIRKGFNDEMVNAVEISKIIEDCGAKAVAVHGRTREEFYSGTADWDIIKKVKEAVTIPVIGNGDIVSPQSAKDMMDKTGCDGIMIGRGAMGNPFIFREIIHYLETGEILEEATVEEKVNMAKRHAKMLVDFKGEHIGIREMRKHISWYTKNLPKSSKLRNEVNKAETIEEMEKLLDLLL